eukprot:350850-Chlamydomonas_euryale.AAC.5
MTAAQAWQLGVVAVAVVTGMAAMLVAAAMVVLVAVVARVAVVAMVAVVGATWAMMFAALVADGAALTSNPSAPHSTLHPALHTLPL